jgi:hypothetical protein
VSCFEHAYAPKKRGRKTARHRGTATERQRDRKVCMYIDIQRERERERERKTYSGVAGARSSDQHPLAGS